MADKKVRVLFIGDSITDAGRDRRNYFQMGNGYPKYSAENIANENPDYDFEFINLGISGNRTSQIYDRLYNDAISLDPDILVLLVGVNDIWHRHFSSHIATTYEQIELNLRLILQRLKNETHAKVIMLKPFLLDGMTNEEIRGDLPRLIEIENALAAEYADDYIHIYDLFIEAMKTQPEERFYSADGVHPNENGARFIAEYVAASVKKFLK